jgi:hypothetical protein
MAIPLSRAADELIRQLRRILTVGGKGNLLVMQAGEFYVRFVAERGSPRLRCETVADRRLGEAALIRLRRMGFEVTPDWCHYVREETIDDEAALANLAHQTVRILLTIYEADPRQIVAFKSELREGTAPSNPAARQALEEVDRFNSPAHWETLFAALREGTVLVPLESDAPDAGVLLLKDPDGNTALPAFTDGAALATYWPGGKPFTWMHGQDFFAWAVQHSLWPVVLNPGGPIAGELKEEHVRRLSAAPAPPARPAPSAALRREPVAVVQRRR